MNCGAAFCMPAGGYTANNRQPAGCPTHNNIPQWNRLVETGRWRQAYDNLAATNNFPEFTARVCPAPCQDSCIVGINDRPVAIKSIERAIIDRAFENHWVQPRTPNQRTGRRIAIVGSGPAGLAAADDLNAAGHRVTLYERADTPGGLLTYGIPSMKLDKAVVQRRIHLLEKSGITFQTRCDVGRDLDPLQLLAQNDALILAPGALAPRDLDLPGRHYDGITPALPYLQAAARHRTQRQPLPKTLDAQHKYVVIIGGGDTGADCIATALRQNAASVTNITRREKPPTNRDPQHPWPGPPATYTLDYAHAEGLARHGQDPRHFSLQPMAFHAQPGTTRVRHIEVADIPRRKNKTGHPPPTRRLPADLVILAAGFTGHDTPALFTPFNLSPDNLRHANPAPGLHLCGDAHLGPSIVVRAIAQGRETAARIQQQLQN